MKTSITKEGDGRYAVEVEVFGAMARAGLVLGGGSRWSAEAPGGDTLGVYATRKAAVKALADDALDPVWIGMRGQSGMTGLPRAYKNDLEIDRRTLRVWKPAGSMVRFLWLLRDNGTNLVPCNLEWSRRELSAVLSAFEREFERQDGLQARAYLIRPGGNIPVGQISFAAAKGLLTKVPDYRIDNARRVLVGPDGKGIAGFEVSGRVAEVGTITVYAEGVPVSHDPLLRSAAAGYFQHHFGSFFGPAVSSVDVRYKPQEKRSVGRGFMPLLACS